MGGDEVKSGKRFSATVPILILMALCMLTGIWCLHSRICSGEKSYVNASEMKNVSVAGPTGKKPELVMQNGHNDTINAIAFSGDGRYMVTGSDDHTIKLWDTRDCSCLRSWIGDPDYVKSVAFSPNGRCIASGTHDKKIKIWDTNSGKCIKTLEWDTIAVNCVTFSSSGRYIASGDYEGAVKIWDSSSGACIKTMKGHSKEVSSVAVSPDERYVASGGADKTVKIWELASGKCIYTLAGHDKEILSVAISPESRYVASRSEGRDVRLWNLKTGKASRVIEGFKYDSISSVAFAMRSGLLVFGGCNEVRMFEPDTGRCVRSLVDNDISYVHALGVSPDGRYVAASGGNRLSLWNADTGKRIISFKDNLLWINSIAVSPDAAYIASGALGTVSVWDFASESAMRSFETNMSFITLLTFLAGGKQVQAIDQHGSLAILELGQGKIIKSLKEDSNYNCYALSSDEKYLASAKARSGTVKIWDTASWKCLHSWDLGIEKINMLAFSPGENILASCGGEHIIELIDISSGKVDRKLESEDLFVEALSYSRDGSYLVSGGFDGIIELWDAKAGRKMKKMETGIYGNCCNVILFSPDGKSFASGNRDGIIRFWDLQGSLLKTLEGHTDEVRYLAFAPNGRFLLSGGRDESLRLWDVKNGSLIITLYGFKGGEWVAATPEGYFDCSEKGRQFIGWTVGLKHYPFEQFFDEFYTPGLLSTVMSGGKIAVKHDLRQGFALPPEVTIASPAKGKSFETNSIEVVIKAVDAGGGIEDIRLYHQGKQVGSSKDLTVTGVARGEKKVDFKVQLIPGENTLRATAYNRDHTVESMPFEIVIQCTMTAKKAGLFVLAVGINAYREEQLNLHSARNDAEAIADYFGRKGERIFARQNIKTLYDQEATRDNIIKAIKTIKDSANPEDVVVMFFSGHGDMDPNDGQYYFIPHDFSTRGQIETMYKTGGVSASTIGGLTRDMKAKKILVMLDTCHSGKALVGFRGMEDVKAMKMLAKSFGLHVLAASKDEQLAGEAKQIGHGIFTQAIIEGMEGKADNDGDGIVTVRELLPYVERRVEELSESTLGMKQYPVIDSRGMDFPLVVR